MNDETKNLAFYLHPDNDPTVYRQEINLVILQAIEQTITQLMGAYHVYYNAFKSKDDDNLYQATSQMDRLKSALDNWFSLVSEPYQEDITKLKELVIAKIKLLRKALAPVHEPDDTLNYNRSKADTDQFINQLRRHITDDLFDAHKNNAQ